MNDKYIIKNCPACRQYQVGVYTCNELYDCDLQRCQDCTDCKMKQIVKECTNSLRFSCERILAEKLLGLLDIQEVK
jgi:hypothetical protein